MWQLFHYGIVSITIDLEVWVVRLLSLLKQAVNHLDISVVTVNEMFE